jgi:uncharacterized membrane protein
MIRQYAAHNNSMEKTWMKQKELLQNFLKCGMAGWCLEILFTSADSIITHDWRMMGRTSLLMFPIYGLGALLGPIGRGIDRWLDEGLWDSLPLRDLALRHGMIDMVLIFCTEYLFGFWMRQFGICPWDYSGRPTNINGLIRLDFAPLWFGTGLLFEGITGKSLIKKGRKKSKEKAVSGL